MNQIGFKSNNEIREIENRQGITLIALVITIVVLLILAGVSIAMLTGQNGILTQATNAKQATKSATVIEDAKTDILGIQTETHSTNIGNLALKNILDKYFDNVPSELTNNTELIAKTEYGNSKVKVYEIYSGEITNTLFAKDIANSTDKQNIYGATISGYTLPSNTSTDVGWKILYANDNNIYLISDNYIERDNLPYTTTDGTLGTLTNRKPNNGNDNYKRAARFNDVINDYYGSDRIADNLKNLNNDYFNVKHYSSTESGNICAVSYMMDTAPWNSKFKDINGKADYVIGGPTIELIFNSYNEKYKKSFISGAVSEAGYKVKKQESDDWVTYIPDMLAINTNTKDSLYCLNDSISLSYAKGYWLSSPCGGNSGAVITVGSGGSLNADSFNNSAGDLGFRPVICLNSNVQLEKVSDTEYRIK